MSKTRGQVDGRPVAGNHSPHQSPRLVFCGCRSRPSFPHHRSRLPFFPGHRATRGAFGSPLASLLRASEARSTELVREGFRNGAPLLDVRPRGGRLVALVPEARDAEPLAYRRAFTLLDVRRLAGRLVALVPGARDAEPLVYSWTVTLLEVCPLGRGLVALVPEKGDAQPLVCCRAITLLETGIHVYWSVFVAFLVRVFNDFVCTRLVRLRLGDVGRELDCVARKGSGGGEDAEARSQDEYRRPHGG